ncbi:hypothetical protein D3C75_1021000 [compost metagenome]
MLVTSSYPVGTYTAASAESVLLPGRCRLANWFLAITTFSPCHHSTPVQPRFFFSEEASVSTCCLLILPTTSNSGVAPAIRLSR